MASASDMYDIRKTQQTSKAVSPSTNLVFTSTLSSLIASASTTEITRGRQRALKRQSDNAMLLSSNRNIHKRAANDMHDDATDAEMERQDPGVTKTLDLRLSKTKLIEKAKVYSALKRGDYVHKESEMETLIDFDRKWVQNGEIVDDSEETGSDQAQGKVVDYEDEYGRARRGTQAEAERMHRKRLKRHIGAKELDLMTARPTMPTQLIYGDTVQTMAFNPEEPVLEKMEAIAKKRDRSMTPPDSKHYEADKEFRTKGVGFYNFLKDERAREQDMKALENERLRTDQSRREREDRKRKRHRAIEDRRKAIGEKRAVKLADSFLDSLE